MTFKVYGMLAVAPINFPSEVEIRVYPHDQETGLWLGGFYSQNERRTWEWVRRFVPLVPYAWPEIEQHLRDGQCAALHIGEHSIDLPERSNNPGILEAAP